MATYRVRIRATRPAPADSVRSEEGLEVAIAAFRRVDAGSHQEAATAIGRMLSGEDSKWAIEKLHVTSEDDDEARVFTFDGDQAHSLGEP